MYYPPHIHKERISMAIEKKVLSLQPENRNRKKRKSYTMKTKKHITTILLAAMLWAGGAMAQTTECAVLPLPFIPNFDTLDYFVSDTVPGDSLPFRPAMCCDIETTAPCYR